MSEENTASQTPQYPLHNDEPNSEEPETEISTNQGMVRHGKMIDSQTVLGMIQTSLNQHKLEMRQWVGPQIASKLTGRKTHDSGGSGKKPNDNTHKPLNAIKQKGKKEKQNRTKEIPRRNCRRCGNKHSGLCKYWKQAIGNLNPPISTRNIITGSRRRGKNYMASPCLKTPIYCYECGAPNHTHRNCSRLTHDGTQMSVAKTTASASRPRETPNLRTGKV